MIIPYKKGDPVIGWPSAACYQGCRPRKNFCGQDVQRHGTSQKVVLFHSPHTGLPLRFTMVAPLCHTLEWVRYTQLFPTRSQNIHRCFRSLGLWCNIWGPVDTPGLVTRMVIAGHYGEGAGPNSVELYSMESCVVRYQCGVQV